MTEAPAQHHPRNPPVKAHAFGTSSLQALFDRVDQSLKKDRLTIESVLHIQRPHSAPSIQVKSAQDFLGKIKPIFVIADPVPGQRLFKSVEQIHDWLVPQSSFCQFPERLLP